MLDSNSTQKKNPAPPHPLRPVNQKPSKLISDQIEKSKKEKGETRDDDRKQGS